MAEDGVSKVSSVEKEVRRTAAIEKKKQRDGETKCWLRAAAAYLSSGRKKTGNRAQ